MKYKFKKYLIPSSLNKRFLLLIIIPILLIQTFTTYFFCERHWDDLKFRMAQSVAQDIVIINYLFARNDQKILEDFVRILKFRFFIENNSSNNLKFVKNKDQEMEELEKQLNRYHINHQFFRVKNTNDVVIMLYNNNSQIYITLPKKRLYTPTTQVFLFWITFTSLIIVIITILFLRNQLKSISRLAKAVDDFGKNNEIGNFRPEGAYEIRKAGYSFLKMKERVDRQIKQRTDMLNAISHDLRTPLTRLKLELEMISSSIDIIDMKNDIIEMEKMIDEYLAFASLNEIEHRTTINIVNHIYNIVQKFQKIYHNVNFISNISEAFYNCSPQMLTRALNNIIENGIKYGNNVEVDLYISSNFIYINIDDMGQGIIPSDMKNIFKPFFRAKECTNKITKGIGLGLAIVNDIITKHGGIIKVSASKKFTGSSFSIILPCGNL